MSSVSFWRLPNTSRLIEQIAETLDERRNCIDFLPESFLDGFEESVREKLSEVSSNDLSLTWEDFDKGQPPLNFLYKPG